MIVTPAALEFIRALILRKKIESPLIAVVWKVGRADLRRGSEGEAFWEREPDEWVTAVIDSAELEHAGMGSLTANFEAHGLKFFLSGRSKSPLLDDCRLDAEDGKLVVYEEAT